MSSEFACSVWWTDLEGNPERPFLAGIFHRPTGEFVSIYGKTDWTDLEDAQAAAEATWHAGPIFEADQQSRSNHA